MSLYHKVGRESLVFFFFVVLLLHKVPPLYELVPELGMLRVHILIVDSRLCNFRWMVHAETGF